MEILLIIVVWCGMAAILCWVAFAYDYCRKKYNFSDFMQSFLAVCLLALTMLAIKTGQLVISGYREEVINMEHSAQYSNCINTLSGLNLDSDFTVEEHCQYFLDILDNEYTHVDDETGGDVDRGAICVDGTHSYSTGRGTCSHHGGVAHWL